MLRLKEHLKWRGLLEFSIRMKLDFNVLSWFPGVVYLLNLDACLKFISALFFSCDALRGYQKQVWFFRLALCVSVGRDKNYYVFITILFLLRILKKDPQ